MRYVTSLLLFCLISTTLWAQIVPFGFWRPKSTSASPFTWIGGGGNANWDTNANWLGGTPPGANDTAIFDNTCVSNCSPTINVAITVGGVNMKSTYGGTVTRTAGINVTVGSAGWTQSAGSLTVNSGTFTVNGPFTVSGNGAISGGTLTLAGNVSFSGAGSRTSAITLSGSANQTVTGTGGVSTGNWTVNKTAGTVTLADNLALGNAGQTLSLTAGTLDLSTRTLNVNSTLTVAYGGVLRCNGGTYTSGTLTHNGVIDCPTYGFNWTGGAGNTSWASAANWSGGVVPTSTDIAQFIDSYCGGNCNANMNATVNVRGLRMGPGYTGTITQLPGIGVTIGNRRWIQYSGTLIGGNTLMTVNQQTDFYGGTYVGGTGTLDFNQSVNLYGGNFTLGSGTTSLSWNLTINPSTVFSASTGVFVLDRTGATQAIDVGTAQFNDVQVIGGSGQDISITGAMRVNGDLLLDNTVDSSQGWFSAGTFEVGGDVTINDFSGGTGLVKLIGSANQTVSGAAQARIGSLEIASTGGVVSFVGNVGLYDDFTYTMGSVNYGTSTIRLVGTSSATDLEQRISAGTTPLNNLVLLGGVWQVVNLTAPLYVSGSLTFENTQTDNNHGQIAGSNLNLSGNLTVTYWNGGTGKVRLVGSTNQTVTGTTQARIGSLEIASTGGVVSFVGDVGLFDDFTYTTGSVNYGTSTIRLMGTDWSSDSEQRISSGTTPLNNLVMNGNGNQVVNLLAPLYVSGSLTFDSMQTDNNHGWIEGSDLNLSGNLTTSYWNGGTGKVRLVGNSNQTVSGAAQARIGSLEIASTGGVVSFVGDVGLFDDFTYTTGSVNYGTSTIRLKGTDWSSDGQQRISAGTTPLNNLVMNGNGWQVVNLLAPLYVSGSLTFDSMQTDNNHGQIAGSNLNLSGNLTVTYWNGGTGKVRLVGSTNQTVTGTAQARIGSLEIASTGGVVSFVGDVGLFDDFTYTTGSVNYGASTIRLMGTDWSSDSEQRISAGTTPLNNLVMNGNGWQVVNLLAPLYVSGSLTFDSMQTDNNHGWIEGSDLNLSGNLTTSYWNGGTGKVRLVGSANQTVSGAAQARIGSLEIASTGGTVSFVGDVGIFDDFTYTTGSVNYGTSTIRLMGTDWSSDSEQRISAGTTPLNNLVLNGNYGQVVNLTAPLYVSGGLTFNNKTADNNHGLLNGSTLFTSGNVTKTYWNGGNAPITFTGSATQTWTGSGTGHPSGTITVNKSGGSVDLGSNISINSGGQDLNLTSGTINMSGRNLTINDTLTLQAGTVINRGGGTLTYGTLNNFGGTINP